MKKQLIILLTIFGIFFSANILTASASELDDFPMLDKPVIMKQAVYTSGNVKLSWEPYKHEDLLGYMILRYTYRDGMIDEDNPLIMMTDAPNTSYKDEYAKDGNWYLYTIFACIGETDVEAISTASDELSVADIVTLKKPTITLSNTSSGINVSWKKITGADGYLIYRKKSSSSKWSSEPYKIVSSGKTTSYTNTSVTAGTGYNYKVEPYLDAVIDSEEYYLSGTCSSSKYIKRLSRPSVNVENTASSMKLTWKKISGATGYQVFRNGTSIGTTKNTYWNSQSYTNGSKYTYQVRAYYQSNDNKYYSAKSVTDTIYRLNRTNIKTLTGGKKTLKVNHYQNAKATGYEIEYARYSNFKNSITKKIKGYKNSTTSLKTNFSGYTYYVRVRPYKTVDGKTYYGVWSTTKSVYVK